MFKKFETRFCFIISAGRPPLGQMPFLVAPEGKILGQSGAIMKYICRKAGNLPPRGGGGWVGTQQIIMHYGTHFKNLIYNFAPLLTVLNALS